MLYFVSAAYFVHRSYFLSLAKIARFSAAFVPALLLPFAAATGLPLPITPSAGCIPVPYTMGDLTCTNTGTVTTSGADGIDAPATNGNATTTNSGTVNTSGSVFGIRTTTDFGDATTTNSGAVNISGNSATGILTQVFIGNATTNNYGTVSVAGIGFSFGSNAGIVTSTFRGNTTTNNYGTVNVSGLIHSAGIVTTTGFGMPAIAPGSGTTVTGGATTATTNNFGNLSVSGIGSTGIFTSTGFGNLPPGTGIFTTAGGVGTAPAPVSGIAFSGADATTTNYGTVSVNGTVNIAPVTLPSKGVPAFGIGGSATGISTLASFGNATTVNNGNVSVTGFSTTGILTTTNFGTATTVNSGTVSVVGTVNNGPPTVSSQIVGGTNFGIKTSAFNGNATVINSGTVSVSGPHNVGISIFAPGASVLINSGTISAPGGIAIQFGNPFDPDTVTLLPGSYIVGAINLIGVNDTVNVNAGSQNLTFNTLAGATVTGNVPYIVSGNRIVSVDPTGFAVTDRALMDFTRAISATLGGRASDAAASGGAGTGGALGFAAYDDSASRFDDAFAQAMGYAKAADNAVVFKNPTMTTPDGTTVWAKGFYGQRTQQADGPVLRSVTNFYGGAIGVDRLARPDLRLGGLVGGGAINTSIDLNSGGAVSDIVFAGVYGRKDFGPAFVDFALLGGHTSNRTTRNVNNNLLANGLETATASFGGWFFSPEIAAGYRYDFAPGWTVTPTARLRYLAANYDGFAETGSTANLTAGGRTLQNAEERADLTLTRTMLSDAGRFQVGLTAGVLGQQRTGSGSVNAILLGQALAFATPGKSSISGGYAGASLDWRTRSGVSLFAAAEYTAMSDSSNTVTGKAGLRYGF